MGVPQYPKDMASEWQKMKRDVKDLFTSANYRRALQEIGATSLRVLTSLEIYPGAFFEFFHQGGTTGMFLGRHLFLGDEADGLYVLRPDGSVAFWTFSRVSDGYGYTAVYDNMGHEILANDANAGQGLSRPYLSVPFADTAELTAPAANHTTTNTTDTPIYTTQFPIQHPRLRINAYVHNSGGGTAEIKVKDTTRGVTVITGTSTGGFISLTDSHPDGWEFLDNNIFDVTIRRSAGAGAVGMTLLNMFGVQS